MTLPVLDQISKGHGRLYSWPPGVTGSCDVGKSYHFWMAASTSLAKGYQNVGNLTSRRAGAILAHSPFSPASQVVRVDLSQSIYGSAYGAASATNTKVNFNIDSGVTQLMRSSGVQRPLEKEEIGGELSYGNYKTWSKTFSPNELYFDVSKKMNFNKPISRMTASPPAKQFHCKEYKEPQDTESEESFFPSN